MYITYKSYEEVVVCTPENEKKTIKEYFTEGGRDIDEYDREVSNDVAISVNARLSVG